MVNENAYDSVLLWIEENYQNESLTKNEECQHLIMLRSLIKKEYPKESICYNDGKKELYICPSCGFICYEKRFRCEICGQRLKHKNQRK